MTESTASSPRLVRHDCATRAGQIGLAWILVGLLLAAVRVDAESMAERLAGAPPNSWVQLNINRFDDVWPPPELKPYGLTRAVIGAWASMAWDPNRRDLLFWGGGHANYLGNEVYRFRTETLTWELASLPSDVWEIRPQDAQYITVDGTANAPISAHTYDNNIFLPLADRFLTIGGAAAHDGRKFRNEAGDSTGPYMWDPMKADPNKVGGLDGSGLDPSYPGGRMWENRDNLLTNSTVDGVNTGEHISMPGARTNMPMNGTSAYREENGIDVVYYGLHGSLWRYSVPDVLDPSQDRYEKIGRTGVATGIEGWGGGAIDTLRNVYFRTAGSSNRASYFSFWDMNDPENLGSANSNHLVNPIDVTGEFDFGRLEYYGVDYDPVNDVYVLWGADGAVWTLKPSGLKTARGYWSAEGWILDRIYDPATRPGPHPQEWAGFFEFTGILGRWDYIPQYQVFLGVAHHNSGDVWAYVPPRGGVGDPDSIRVLPVSGHVTSEGGGSSQFQVQLRSKPSEDVEVTFTSSDPGEGHVSPAVVVFTPGTWNQAVFVTVTGVDDDEDDGDVSYLVNGTSVSADPAYHGLQSVPVQVENADDDLPANALLGENFSSGSLAGWTAWSEGPMNAGPADWRVQNSVLVQRANSWAGSLGSEIPKPGVNIVYDAGYGWTDYQLSATLRSTDDDAIGVLFRFNDSDNFYRFSWDRERSVRRLVKKSGGSYTLLAQDTVPYVTGRSYQVQVLAQGEQLRVWVDGQPVLQAHDPDHIGGSVGFYTWGNSVGEFDDLLVEPLSGGTVNEPPEILDAGATPARILDSETSQLYVDALDPDDGPRPLSYRWSVLSGGGSFDDSTSPVPGYIPANVAGFTEVVLEVQVSDGAATRTRTVALEVDDAGGGPPPALLREDFSAGSLAGWTAWSEGPMNAGPADWRVQNSVLVQRANSWAGSLGSEIPKPGVNIVYDTGYGWTDYQLSATLRSTDNDAIGVLFRFNDSDNFYRFSWDRERSVRRLVKKSGGSYTLLAQDTVPYVTGRSYQVQVLAQGEQLQVRVDGQPVLQAHDPDHIGGSVGFYTWANSVGEFDDLLVEPLSGGTVNEPPEILDAGATPARILDSETSQLYVDALDPDDGPRPLSYRWSVLSGGGSFDDSTSPVPGYIPANVAGFTEVVLEVQVSDGAATRTRTVALEVDDAGGGPPPALLREDFSAGSLAGWTAWSEGPMNAGPADWRVQNSVLVQRANSWAGSLGSEIPKPGVNIVYDTGYGWTDYQLSATLRSTDNDAIGVLFRFNDSDNFYRFSWDRERSVRRLVKKSGGSYTLLAQDTVPYVTGRSYQVQVLAQGEQLRVWVDGQPVLQAHDPDHIGGSVGFYTWANSVGEFDDLLVEPR